MTILSALPTRSLTCLLTVILVGSAVVSSNSTRCAIKETVSRDMASIDGLYWSKYEVTSAEYAVSTCHGCISPICHKVSGVI